MEESGDDDDDDDGGGCKSAICRGSKEKEGDDIPLPSVDDDVSLWWILDMTTFLDLIQCVCVRKNVS